MKPNQANFVQRFVYKRMKKTIIKALLITLRYWNCSINILRTKKNKTKICYTLRHLFLGTSKFKIYEKILLKDFSVISRS